MHVLPFRIRYIGGNWHTIRLSYLVPRQGMLGLIQGIGTRGYSCPVCCSAVDRQTPDFVRSSERKVKWGNFAKTYFVVT